jgi:hypothetical protein
MANMNANQAAETLAGNTESGSGKWLTVKQSAWLFGVASREVGGKHIRDCAGIFADNRGWDAHMNPNGCAYIRISAPAVNEYHQRREQAKLAIAEMEAQGCPEGLIAPLKRLYNL